MIRPRRSSCADRNANSIRFKVRRRPGLSRGWERRVGAKAADRWDQLDLPVLIVSGEDNLVLETLSKQAGAIAWLAKPPKAARLRALVVSRVEGFQGPDGSTSFCPTRLIASISS